MALSHKELHDFVQKCIDEEIEIQKPDSTTYIVKIGTTNIGDNCYKGFQYTISKKSKKYVSFDLLYTAYDKLITDKRITKKEFENDKKFSTEVTGRPCNFTTVGGIFVELKIAQYTGDGEYTYIGK